VPAANAKPSSDAEGSKDEQDKKQPDDNQDNEKSGRELNLDPIVVDAFQRILRKEEKMLETAVRKSELPDQVQHSRYVRTLLEPLFSVCDREVNPKYIVVC
jgi:hypothetical protein